MFIIGQLKITRFNSGINFEKWHDSSKYKKGLQKVDKCMGNEIFYAFLLNCKYSSVPELITSTRSGRN